MIYLQINRKDNEYIALRYAKNDKLVEEKNGRYDVEFEYPLVHEITFEDGKKEKVHNLFKKFAFIKCDTPRHGQQLFFITDIQKLVKGVKIYAKHIGFLTKKLYVKKFSFKEQTCSSVFNGISSTISDENRFSFYSDIADIHTINMENKMLFDILLSSEFSISTLWQGTYLFDNYRIKYLARRGKDTEYIVANRKNVNDINIKQDADNVVTRLYMKANKRADNEKEKDVVFETVVESPLINEYPYILADFREYEDSFRTLGALKKYGENLFKTFRIDLPKESFSLVGTDEINSYNLDIDDTCIIYYEDYKIHKRIDVVGYTFSPMEFRYLQVDFGYKLKSLSDTLLNKTDKKIKIKNENLLNNIDSKIEKSTNNISDKVEKTKKEIEEEIKKNILENKIALDIVIKNIKANLEEEIEKAKKYLDEEQVKALSNAETQRYIRTKEGQQELIKSITADVVWLKAVITDTEILNTIVANIDLAKIKKLIVDTAFIEQIISKEEFRQQFEDMGANVTNIFSKLKNSITLAIQTKFKDQMGQIKEELNALLDVKTNEIVSSVSSKISDKTEGIKSELLSVINQNKNEINLSVEKIQKGEDVITWSDDLVKDSNGMTKSEGFSGFYLKEGLLNNETYRAVFDVNNAEDISKSKLVLGFKKIDISRNMFEKENEFLNLKDISPGHNDFNFTANDERYNHFFDVSRVDGNSIYITFTDEFYNDFKNQEVTFSFKTARGVMYYDFDNGIDCNVYNSSNEFVVFKTVVKDKGFSLWIKDTENNFLDTKHTAFKNFKESFKVGVNYLWFYDSFRKEKYFEDVEKTFYRDKEIEVTEEEERQEEEERKIPFNYLIDSINVVTKNSAYKVDIDNISISSSIAYDIDEIPIIRIKLNEIMVETLIFEEGNSLIFSFKASFDENTKSICSFCSNFNGFNDFSSQNNLLYDNVDNFKKICISATKEPIDGRIPLNEGRNEIELSNLKCETKYEKVGFAKYICFVPPFREREGRFFIDDFSIRNFQVEFKKKETVTKKVPVKKKKIIQEPYTKMVKEERERLVPLKLDISNCHLYKKNIQKSAFVKKDEHDKDVNEINKDISNIKIKSNEIVSTVSRLENDTEEKLTKINQKADNISLSVNSVSTSVNEINKEINLIKEEDRNRKAGSDLYFYTTERLLADKEYKLIFNLESAESPSSVRIYNCKSSYDYHIKKGTNNLVVSFSSDRGNINIDSGGDKVITDIRLFKNDGIDTQRLVSKENVISAINLDESGVKIKGSKVEISGNVDISGDVIIHKINNTSRSTTISGDKIESGTIKGATLDASTKLKVGYYGFMQPVTNGIQINAPENYGANYGVGIQLCGKYENLSDGKYVPKGLFIYEDSDFDSSNTARRSNTTLATINGRVQCLSNKDGNGKQIEGFAVVSENEWNASGDGYFNIFNVLYNNKYSSTFVFGGAGFWKAIDCRDYSDIRLKHGINDTKIEALDVFKKMSFKEFYWNENGSFEPIGLIAQDVEKLDKNLVGSFEDSETKEESKFIKNYALNIYTAKAIQELENEVSKLKEEVKRLRGLYEKH